MAASQWLVEDFPTVLLSDLRSLKRTGQTQPYK